MSSQNPIIQPFLLMPCQSQINGASYYCCFLPLYIPSQMVISNNQQQIPNSQVKINNSKQLPNSLKQGVNGPASAKPNDLKQIKVNKQKLQKVQKKKKKQKKKQKKRQDQSEGQNNNHDCQYEPQNSPVSHKSKKSKNSLSNVVNQIISFVKKNKRTLKIIQKLFKGNSQKIRVFTEFFQKLIRKSKSYRNVEYLYKIMTLQPQSQGYKLLYYQSRRYDKILEPISAKLSQNQFKKAFRVLTFYFLNHQCTQSILTSKKLLDGKFEHLQRRRYIKNVLQICLSQNLHPKEVQAMKSQYKQ